MPDDRDYYTLAEIAAMRGVTPIAVRKWVSTGKLKAYRPGFREWRVNKEYYAQWLRDKEAKEHNDAD
jgi:excisionase family DNA binding protein